jgi:bifunctional ADP-heptose synthase (sugar kinase/adenylyltransferase)
LLDQKIIAGIRGLVVGDVMIDQHWYGDVKRISTEAPIPIVRLCSEHNRLGGAANFAFNIKTLAAQIRLLKSVGQNYISNCLREHLTACNIDTVLVKNQQQKTIVNLKLLSSSQRMIRINFQSKSSQLKQ